mmetsp:Transcript_55774/g.155479  ORF Transcript_55774/g.155479 Transcript_55774/m.155479 type:complete len:226 (+) Transcript_55774:620-1297(+)
MASRPHEQLVTPSSELFLPWGACAEPLGFFSSARICRRLGASCATAGSDLPQPAACAARRAAVKTADGPWPSPLLSSVPVGATVPPAACFGRTKSPSVGGGLGSGFGDFPGVAPEPLAEQGTGYAGGDFAAWPRGVASTTPLELPVDPRLRCAETATQDEASTSNAEVGEPGTDDPDRLATFTSGDFDCGAAAGDVPFVAPSGSMAAVKGSEADADDAGETRAPA